MSDLFQLTHFIHMHLLSKATTTMYASFRLEIWVACLYIITQKHTDASQSIDNLYLWLLENHLPSNSISPFQHIFIHENQMHRPFFPKMVIIGRVYVSNMSSLSTIINKNANKRLADQQIMLHRNSFGGGNCMQCSGFSMHWDAFRSDTTLKYVLLTSLASTRHMVGYINVSLLYCCRHHECYFLGMGKSCRLTSFHATYMQSKTRVEAMGMQKSARLAVCLFAFEKTFILPRSGTFD